MSIVGSKTPVSIVNEYFIALGIMPSYQLIGCETGTQNNTFKFRLTAGEYFSEGQGSSKQQAKHNAAQELIEILRHQKEEPTNQLNIALQKLSCPQDNLIAFNAVGGLSEYCLAKNYPEAVFDLVRDEGPPHEKIFSYKCSVSNLNEIGTSRTKKQAKQQAAYSMLVRLKQLCGEEVNAVVKVNLEKPPPPPPEDFSKKDEDAMKVYLKASSSRRAAVQTSYVKDQFRAYAALLDKSPTLARLSNEETRQALFDEPYNALKNFAKEVDIEVKTHVVKGRSKSLTFVLLKLSPILCRSGPTLDKASLNALNCILSFL